MKDLWIKFLSATLILRSFKIMKTFISKTQLICTIKVQIFESEI